MSKEQKKRIREMVEMEDVNGYSTADFVCEWCNCRTAEIDEGGDIWIAGPQAGHWLSEEECDSFFEWLDR